MKEKFKDKVLKIHCSIEEHTPKSYTSYRIKEGRAFLRLHPKKITLRLPFKNISSEDKDDFCLKDNSKRYPRHELQTKGPKLNEKYLDDRFIKIVKAAFEYSKNEVKNHL